MVGQLYDNQNVEKNQDDANSCSQTSNPKIKNMINIADDRKSSEIGTCRSSCALISHENKPEQCGNFLNVVSHNNREYKNSKAVSENQEEVRKHYNTIKNKSRYERSISKHINIRGAHNFIKSMIFVKYIKKGDCVLDFGIGKGGDFHKYQACLIKSLYGIDISNLSILDAADRARDPDSIFNFKIVLKTVNCFTELFNLNKRFDVLSSMFSFHYCFGSERNVDITIKHFKNHILPGGLLLIVIPSKKEILARLKQNRLSNKFFKIEFRQPKESSLFGQAYSYTLQDSVIDCIEFLVDVDELSKKMQLEGFELICEEGFESFLQLHKQTYPDKFKKMVKAELSPEELEVISLHQILIYKMHA